MELIAFPLELIAGSIFALTYLLFLSDMLNKTVAALLGSMLMVMLGVLNFAEVGTFIDYKTLTVALGMMIVVNVVNKSGLFEYISIKAIKITKGDPVKILIVLCLLALPITAFFDNITSSLVLGSLIITATSILALDFVPFLIAIAIVINIGGLLTPVASLPNMMITTSAGFGFMSFIGYMLPLAALLVITTLLYFKISMGADIKKRVRKTSKDELATLDERSVIKDPKLFRNSTIMLGLIIIAFLTHEHFHIGVESIALAGAIIMLTLSGADPEEMFSEVHWSTLAFLIGIFIVVGGVDKVGLLDRISVLLSNVVTSEFSASMAVLFSASGLTTILNNIPITAVYVPIVNDLSILLNVSPHNIFYALVVAVGLGGNITPIGSPSSIIATGLAEKHGKRITFGMYFRVGIVLTLIHLVISAIYLFIRIKVM